MSRARRILVVITAAARRGLRLAVPEDHRRLPRDPLEMAARLLRFGAEVRVVDQQGEQLKGRVVRREARLWRADLVLLYAGGSRVRRDPVPDASPLEDLAHGWHAGCRVVAAGPLAELYADELVQRLPGLAGALRGDVSEALVHAGPDDEVPGLWVAGRGGPEPLPRATDADAAPAWQLLPLEAWARSDLNGKPVAGILTLPGDGPQDVKASLELVRHAVHRTGAGRLDFEDDDLGARPEFARRLARGMFSAAPGLPWSCRLRADHVDPMLALHLMQGGCTEVLLTAPSGADAPGRLPMDDPDRAPIESAVESLRVSGMSVQVEHVIGRPEHDLEILPAWHRWFHDRRMAVAPRVRVLHAGAKGPAEPKLDEARARAGCWDNELRPRDVERAVRALLPLQAAVLARP